MGVSLGWSEGEHITCNIAFSPLRLLEEPNYRNMILEGLNRCIMTGGNYILRSNENRCKFSIEIASSGGVIEIEPDFSVEESCKEAYHKTFMCICYFLMAKKYKGLHLTTPGGYIYVSEGLLHVSTEKPEMFSIASEILRNVQNITGILFYECSFSEKINEIIQIGLNEVKNVKEIYFCKCKLNSPLFEELYKTVGFCPNLNKLGMYGCDFWGDTSNRLTPVINLMLQCGNIERFVLCGSSLSSEDIKKLVVVLETYTALRVLDLSENPIGDDGAQLLCDLLRSNPFIEELILAQNVRKRRVVNLISEKGVKALIDALTDAHGLYGRSLNCLDLRGNSTSPELMEEILRAKQAGLLHTNVLLLNLAASTLPLQGVPPQNHVSDDEEGTGSDCDGFADTEDLPCVKEAKEPTDLGYSSWEEEWDDYCYSEEYALRTRDSSSEEEKVEEIEEVEEEEEEEEEEIDSASLESE